MAVAINSDVMKQLQAPFPPSQIEWRVGSTTTDKSRGLALAYVTNRAIQNRLDDAFGVFGWKNEFREWKGSSQICGISVKDQVTNEWVTKWDGADDSATEAVKGGLSDAMKRAAYQWGIGRYLYNLESIWVALKPAGKSYAIAETPQLPAWALPEGFQPATPPPAKAATKPPASPATTPASTPAPFVPPSATKSTYACSGCGKAITEKEHRFSQSKLGHPLCYHCQHSGATTTAPQSEDNWDPNIEPPPM